MTFTFELLRASLRVGFRAGNDCGGHCKLEGIADSERNKAGRERGREEIWEKLPWAAIRRPGPAMTGAGGEVGAEGTGPGGRLRIRGTGQRHSFITTTVREQRPRSHATGRFFPELNEPARPTAARPVSPRPGG